MTPIPASWPYSPFIAHRGAGRYAPENTLAAIRLGAQHRFTMMEYDVKLSRDGVPVLLHDDTLDRTSSSSGPAGALTLAELASIDFGAWHSRDYAGEPIATLFSVAAYTLANGIHSNIEIKPSTGTDAETGHEVALAARTLWANSDTPPLLSSFSREALGAARDAAPELPRALLFGRELPPDWLDAAGALQCRGINLNDRSVTPDIARQVLDAGFTLAVYTVNNPERARELLGMGCHGIFTDEIMTISPVYFT